MAPKTADPATKGFAKASLYDTHRPSYPPEVVDDLLSQLQVKGIKNALIIDLGAGTGKFSQLLATRDEDYDIVAVEPHEEMRKACMAKKLDRVKVVDGVANDMPVETQSADAVIVAQAWHWFATEESLEEIYRVSSNPFTIQAADPLFSLPLGEDSAEFVDWLRPEAIWDRFRSLSQITILEGEELASVEDKISAAMNAPDIEKNDKGELPLHRRVIYAWTSSIPGASLKSGG
ncbi:MAG: hypothetical protein Q9170_000133 [Blastenia crenularia]